MFKELCTLTTTGIFHGKFWIVLVYLPRSEYMKQPTFIFALFTIFLTKNFQQTYVNLRVFLLTQPPSPWLVGPASSPPLKGPGDLSHPLVRCGTSREKNDSIQSGLNQHSWLETACIYQRWWMMGIFWFPQAMWQVYTGEWVSWFSDVVVGRGWTNKKCVGGRIQEKTKRNYSRFDSFHMVKRSHELTWAPNSVFEGKSPWAVNLDDGLCKRPKWVSFG